MIQVNPNERIQLATVLSDTTDAGTYYVQAVMRNTATGKVLGTANLTVDPTNSRRFTGAIAAPGVQGQGLWIDITTTIYTDAAYTAKSPVYQEVNERYVVAIRWNMAIGGAGNGDPFSQQEKTASTREAIREEMALVLEEIGKLGSPTVVVEGQVVANPKAKGISKKAIADLQTKLAETVELGLSKRAGLARKERETQAEALTAGLGGVKKELVSTHKAALKDIKSEVVDSNTKALEEMRTELDAALAAFKKTPELKAVLVKFDPLMKTLDRLANRLEYVWEHQYLKEASDTVPVLPPASSKTTRRPSDGVIPIADVMAAHADRRKTLFGAEAPPIPSPSDFLPETPSASRAPSEGVIPIHQRVPESALPAAGPSAEPDRVPILPPDFEINPSKRKPSEHVVPVHTIRNNRAALAKLPPPLS